MSLYHVSPTRSPPWYIILAMCHLPCHLLDMSAWHVSAMIPSPGHLGMPGYHFPCHQQSSFERHVGGFTSAPFGYRMHSDWSIPKLGVKQVLEIKGPLILMHFCLPNEILCCRSIFLVVVWSYRMCYFILHLVHFSNSPLAIEFGLLMSFWHHADVIQKLG